MMPLDSFLLLYALLSFASFGSSLRLLELGVPAVVDVRDRATLVCKFDLEGDHFFSLKWYKEELEFFRYMPDYVPRIQTFRVHGVNLLESESNISAITLSPLEYASSGTYRCEVSAEAPHFNVVYRHANMTVLGLPRHDPTINGIQESYAIGSYVTANCTSSPSNPPARMDWFINGVKAQQWFIDHYRRADDDDDGDGDGDGEDEDEEEEDDDDDDDLGLETRTIGLKFQAESGHFHQRKDGTLSLVCSATVADRTRSTEIRAYLSKLTKEKFAQQFTNYCGKIIPSFYVLLAVAIFPTSIEYKLMTYTKYF